MDARWWHQDGEHIVCDLCPRSCRLRPGQRGFCHSRRATEAGMELTSWGRCSGLAVDPIEKKPLYHFLPRSSVLSFGTTGCNLACRFCQNSDISMVRRAERLQTPALPEPIAALAVDHGCASVAFTYNEPLISAEYALDVAAACHAVGVRTVAVTNGYVSPGAREAFFAGMDAANVDLKALSDAFYREWTSARLEPVLDTLRHVAHETGVWLEVTTLLIPGLNDSPAQVSELVRWLADELGPDVPLHLSAFHPAHRVTDRPRTPASTLLRARDQALTAGLRFVYTGNIGHTDTGSTWCPGCGALLVERTGYRHGRWGLADGRCARCDQPIPGVFA